MSNSIKKQQFISRWNNAVICCIAKGEELYITEWIIYHLAMGFQRIYIYDNNENQNQLPIFLSKQKEFPLIKSKVRIIYFPGKIKQIPAYNHFLKKFSRLWRWVAFLDCDEFITIKHPQLLPIKRFLSKFCRQGTLAIHWRLFGDSGQPNYKPINLTERFTQCESVLNNHVKCISVCNHISRMSNPHSPILKKNRIQHDYLGRICNGPINQIGLDESNIGVYINHYFCKSREEWNYKKNRGMADNMNIRSDIEFDSHNKNQTTDMFAYHFYKSIS